MYTQIYFSDLDCSMIFDIKTLKITNSESKWLFLAHLKLNENEKKTSSRNLREF